MSGKPPTVVIASSSAFLTIALRQILSGAAKVTIVAEARTAASAVAALEGSRVDVAVVDTALLTPEPDNPLVRLIQSRRAPTLLIDPKADVDAPTPLGPGEIVRLSGSDKTGSYDLGPIKAQLASTLARVVETWRQRTQSPAVLLLPRSAPDVRRARRTAEAVVIGVSTGGPMVLTSMLKGLDAPTLPVIIAQHMPADQTASFAAHLALETGLRVVEQGRGALPDIGVISVLRGGADYRFIPKQGERLQLRVTDVPDNPFHPGIDVLLLSAAEHEIAVAVAILTGMGEDGAEGVRALAAQGMSVVAQSPETCAVPGMPTAAMATGGVSEVLGPNAIVERLNGWMRKGSVSMRRTAS
ncbi:MAG: chemotaxis protein CheB [Vicinamibacteria bacterium]|nr:chemotaxis protein CheB [Vicinamibacteria bacterium]